MCLQCPNVGCLNSGHAYSHAQATGHVFGISISSGQMICFKCKDVVGDPRLERIRVLSLKSSGMLSTYPGLPVYNCEHETHREKLIKVESRLPTFKASKGLKGFINMGSTCFMSSILQAMVHNPFIRDYYLSGSHLDCTRDVEDCISCCVGEIFKDFYTSTSTTGFGPSSLLSAAWKVKKSLAGYSEQDAHEFWQFLIHQLHKNDTKCSKNRESTPSLDSGSSSSGDDKYLAANPLFNCDCITHRTFAGELQSTLTCVECGNERVTVDPMLDLSLEIQEKREPMKTLDECLRKFTKPERLDILYDCRSCKKKTGVTKQLKIRKLPPTLCIQLKRFEHVGVSTKIDAHIDVPFMLDMAKYTLNGKRNGDFGSDLYELYAVVYHTGSVNTGHYISIVKDRDGMWFKFDDARVVRVSEKEVLAAQAYLLFYIIHEMP
ncbi:DEKNAAC104243 [Brettanomyces naardenensis]|uniref:Ubiquitin carboxyl-terminal hydrolase n=1 Tax=Brettanomyces naardenensis TaxID=13370 RepID=A0A448YQ09_BRENA|nr:DEKNAAC104243 [Brettanomyces naardenensis]